MRKLAVIVGVMALAVSMATSQGWMSAYEAGLAAAKTGKWTDARVAFKQALAYRTEDVSNETFLPGSITERRKWRNGAPYSPNFLAAYSGFKYALTLTGEDKTGLLNDVTAEFEGLLAKNQFSASTFYFLNQIFVITGNTEKRLQLQEKYQQVSSKLTWRVDGDGMVPEDVAAVGQTYAAAGTGAAATTTSGAGQTTNAGTGTPVVTGTTAPPSVGAQTPVAPAGNIAPLPEKYALIIGNAMSGIQGGALPFASDDAQRMREALVTHAGYLDTNIDLIINATSEQIRSSVKALADRIPEEATVFIYFTGVGVNMDGKDFVAGVEAASANESAAMVGKGEIYSMLMRKGAKVYAFFQANRPITTGRYFGMEVPMVGRIAQVQGTLPGASVASYTRNGKEVGLFTDSLIGVLGQLRTNRIPIQEFGWQVFYRMRRGGTGEFGGGSNQTPTLPVLINMSSDSKF